MDSGNSVTPPTELSRTELKSRYSIVFASDLFGDRSLYSRVATMRPFFGFGLTASFSIKLLIELELMSNLGTRALSSQLSMT